jgi:hypothetical protein
MLQYGFGNNDYRHGHKKEQWMMTNMHLRLIRKCPGRQCDPVTSSKQTGPALHNSDHTPQKDVSEVK